MPKVWMLQWMKNKMTKSTPKSKYRSVYVTHEAAKIMLAVYDMADSAGLTWMELTNILAEETSRRIEKMTWKNGKRRLDFEPKD
jgi:hypothetical protein